MYLCIYYIFYVFYDYSQNCSRICSICSSTFCIWFHMRTRTKVVHENVSHGCYKVRKFQSTKIIKLLNNIEVTFMKEMSFNCISIHTNFYQNRSINKCDFSIKVVLHEVILHFIKKSVPLKCKHSWKVLKRLGIK